MATVFQCDECGKIHSETDAIIGLYISFRDKGFEEHEELIDGLFCNKGCLKKFIDSGKLRKIIL